MEYKVSLIIPIYNCEKYLNETLGSLKNQTIGFNNIQVILVDDNSTDYSKYIIDSFINENDNSIAIYLPVNSGAAGLPRNLGIEAATGEYIMFVDSDDILNTKACEELYNLAKLNGSDIYIGKYTTFKQDRSWESKVYKNNLNYEFVNKEIKEVPELLNASFNLMNKIFLKKFILENNLEFSIGVISQDALFTTEAYMRSKKISFIPIEIYKYRIRDDKDNLSVTQIRNVKYFEDFIFIRKRIIDIYKKYGILDYMEVRYMKDLKWLLYQLRLAFKFKDETMSIFENYVKLIKVIQPFVSIILKSQLESLNDIDRNIINLIVDKRYEECVNMLNDVCIV